MERYSIISDKNPREIVLLRGSGCKWRKCRFCDYHLDFSKDEAANFNLNQKVLAKVTGLYHRLEVINSGSICDLDSNTMTQIKTICHAKDIRQVHFECHWIDRSCIKTLREDFAALGICLKFKIGVETFDPLFRESYLVKGIDEADPARIAEDFDECCLLFGIPGQTAESMNADIETGLACFERVCVNIMVENSTAIKPDPAVIDTFKKDVMANYLHNRRVDILLNNTDFGVGGKSNA